MKSADTKAARFAEARLDPPKKTLDAHLTRGASGATVGDMETEDTVRKLVAQALALLEKADDLIATAADDAEWADEGGHEFVAAQGDLSEAISAIGAFANAVE